MRVEGIHLMANGHLVAPVRSFRHASGIWNLHGSVAAYMR